MRRSRCGGRQLTCSDNKRTTLSHRKSNTFRTFSDTCPGNPVTCYRNFPFYTPGLECDAYSISAIYVSVKRASNGFEIQLYAQTQPNQKTHTLIQSSVLVHYCGCIRVPNVSMTVWCERYDYCEWLLCCTSRAHAFVVEYSRYARLSCATLVQRTHPHLLALPT